MAEARLSKQHKQRHRKRAWRHFSCLLHSLLHKSLFILEHGDQRDVFANKFCNEFCNDFKTEPCLQTSETETVAIRSYFWLLTMTHDNLSKIIASSAITFVVFVFLIESKHKYRPLGPCRTLFKLSSYSQCGCVYFCLKCDSRSEILTWVFCAYSRSGFTKRIVQLVLNCETWRMNWSAYQQI